jgi:hypothetical protein
MPFGCHRLLTSLGFGLGVFSRCQPQATGVEYHSFRPFLIRVHPDVVHCFSGTSEGRERAIGTQEHQFAAKAP